MVINPQNDCTWTFQNGILSINLTTDEGKSYLFKTHFSVDDLYMKPEVNASFTIKEGELLTYYLEGINKILKDEGSALDLGINAVACEQYTKPAIPTSRYFIMGSQREYEVLEGDVVSVYTNEFKCGDCVVLEPRDADGLTRLMLLNRELLLDVKQHRGYSLGQMIRVDPECVIEFRELNNRRNCHKYA